MTAASRCVVVLITAPVGRSSDLAQFLIRKKLAACVNIIPKVRSVYRWKGKIEKSSESLLITKTQKRRWARLRAEVRRVHPYTVPEIISLPITAGHKDYLHWVIESTRSPV